MSRDGCGVEIADVLPSARAASLAAIGSTLVCFLALRSVSGFDALPEILSRTFVLFLPVTAAALTYLGLAAALRSPELDDVVARIRRQIPRMSPSDRARAPLNVYCLRPEQLLEVALANPASVRDANLTGRVREFLDKPGWKQRNIGVKLVGILKIRALRYQLVDIVSCRERVRPLHRLLGGDFRQPGFVRRNAVHSLRQIESMDQDVERALLTALSDPYYEVRAAACEALASYAKELSPPARRLAQFRLKGMVGERNFEVVVAAVKALTAAALKADVLETLQTLHYHPNWQVRHAVVRAYHELYRRGVVEDRDLIRRRLDDILITCDSFTPTFALKETMARVRRGLMDEKERVLEAEA